MINRKVLSELAIHEPRSFQVRKSFFSKNHIPAKTFNARNLFVISDFWSLSKPNPGRST